MGQLYFASKTELPSMTTNHCDYDTFQYILPDEYLIWLLNKELWMEILHSVF